MNNNLLTFLEHNRPLASRRPNNHNTAAQLANNSAGGSSNDADDDEEHVAQRVDETIRAFRAQPPPHLRHQHQVVSLEELALRSLVDQAHACAHDNLLFFMRRARLRAHLIQALTLAYNCLFEPDAVCQHIALAHTLVQDEMEQRI